MFFAEGAYLRLEKFFFIYVTLKPKYENIIREDIFLKNIIYVH